MTRFLLSTSTTASFHYLSLLEQCSSLRILKQLHSLSITLGLARFAYITSRILAFYALLNSGRDMRHARQLFDEIPQPTIFNWNTMIKGYSRTQEPENGLWVYAVMRRRAVKPNMHTFPSAIRACACCSSLSQVHGHVFKLGFDLDVFVTSSLIKRYGDLGLVEFAYRVFDESVNRNVVCWTSLITGFCQHGLVDRARKLFDGMLERNEVSWSAMITGYVQNDRYEEAIVLFQEVKHRAVVNLNDALLVSVLRASANSGASEEGKWIHWYIDAKRLHYGLELGTALVDFYSKCGSIDLAKRVFGKMPVKDVMAWSTMIMGFALNGHCYLALDAFSNMITSETRPNAVTFVGVLTACNHRGLVDEGQAYFKEMTAVYGLSPTIEHYGCMVDLFSRAGKIAEAEELVRSMPMKPDEAIWGALLNGCLMHGHIELGEQVGKHVVKLDPQHCGRYVSLANVYACLGRWKSVLDVRRAMKERGILTTPGWSLIEANGVGYRFLADDRKHPQCEEIHQMLSNLYGEMVYAQRREQYFN